MPLALRPPTYLSFLPLTQRKNKMGSVGIGIADLIEFGCWCWIDLLLLIERVCSESRCDGVLLAHLLICDS